MSKRILTVIVLIVFSFARSVGAADECSRTATMEIYSNALAHQETGDILGYELAVERHDDSTVKAFFYVYEGAPNNEAIPLSGRLSGKNLSLQGQWVEHLIEYPSKKKILQTYFIRIEGVLVPASFRGEVTIEGMGERESVRLKRTKSIWLCSRLGQ